MRKILKQVNLIIDQGNTTIKLAVFNAFALETLITYDTWNEPVIEDFLSGYDIEACIYSSVARKCDEHVDFFRNRIPMFHLFHLTVACLYV